MNSYMAKTVTISEGITTIEAQAFSCCNNITTVMMPASITFISSKVFEECRRLTDIYYNGTIAEWEAIAKSGDWDLKTLSYTVHCIDGDIPKK